MMTLIFILLIILSSWLFARHEFIRWKESYIEENPIKDRELNSEWHDYSAFMRGAFLILGIFWFLSSCNYLQNNRAEFYFINYTIYFNYIVFLVNGFMLIILHWFLADGIMNLYKAPYCSFRKKLNWISLWFYTNSNINGSTARTERIDRRIKITAMVVAIAIFTYSRLIL